MPWEWITVGLAVVLVIQIAIYRVSLKENRGLTNLLILILLHDDVCAFRRKDLLEFLRVSDAKNGYSLYSQVLQAAFKSAMKQERGGEAGIAHALWAAKMTT